MKKIFKGIFFLIVFLLIVSSIFFVSEYFRKGKLAITVSMPSTYYSGNNINATVSVKKTEENQLTDAKITARLVDADGKYVKKVKSVYELEEGENVDVVLEVPEDLETGKYYLRIKATKGLLKDSTKIPISIIKDVKANTTISLDKGIYKPGDEVNFRALVLSKKDNTPVTNNIKICIYDGNGNKVYTNSTKTSEYGIVSGTFKLADEVNSGTYKIEVETESQKYSKNFNVNPYITPKFEVQIKTDKENYIVGDTAQITVSGKYFFGEPVKAGNVTGTINGKEVLGITNDQGDFVTNYKFEEAEKINLDFSLTDSSNYMIETTKNVYCGTDKYEIEILPEYGFIAKDVDNEIYIITKNIDGTPIKTYSTINFGNISKQVISDENGVGKIILTKNETIENNVKVAKIVSEDMSGSKVEKSVELEVNNSYNTLIKTDKVKYNSDEDIEISVNSRTDLNHLIYVFKGNELLKTISTDSDSCKINLDGITGLIDIIVENDYSKNTSPYYRYSSSNSYLKYSKRTIFIKPDQALNIDIKTDKEEYKPGEELKLSFTTTNENNENIDAALLVSILDEAILSLAENDLSIDNIKLALDDIELGENITAADVYAMVVDETSETSLKALLLKQDSDNIKILKNTYICDYNEFYLTIGIILAILTVILVITYIYISREKARLVIKSAIVSIVNIGFIFAVLSMFLTEFICTYVYIDSTGIALLLELVMAVVAYILILYKESDLIFNFVKNLIVIPYVLILLGTVCIEIIAEVSTWSYSETETIVSAFVIIIYLILVTVLNSFKKRDNLGKKAEKIYKFCLAIGKVFVFYLAMAIVAEFIDEYAILVGILLYVLYRKIILRDTKTKVKNGKILFSVNPSEVVGMCTGAFMVICLVLLIVLVAANNKKSHVYNSRYDTGLYEDVILPETSINSMNKDSGSTMTFGDISTDSVTDNAFDISGAATSSKSESMLDNIDIFQSNEESIYEDTKQENESLETETEENAVEENIRNVFLESLAFIPELITENGKVEYVTPISDNITTWNIQTVGNTKQGNVGYNSKSFKVFKEFFVDFSLPTNSVVTDKVSIPVTLYNYTEKAMQVSVNVKENDWSQIGEYSKIVNVPANGTQMIYVPLEIVKAGNNILRIETSSDGVSDIVEKTLTVKPNGLEKNDVVSAGMIDGDYEQDIIFNENAIEGTEKIKFKLYASPMIQVIENIDAMLEMPTGCFEQTSSSLYPDILVLKYLRENKLSNPELEEKALNYINVGYQKLLTYEVPRTKGGYSLYGDYPAEPVITAFGLMEMDELKDVYEIDENVIKNMTEYLFDVQNLNGTFDYKTTYIGGAASTDDLAMNAYIIWALSEVCPEDSRLEKSIKYLEKNISETSDSYTLALMANVFVNTNNKQLANDVMEAINQNIVVTNNGAYVTSTIRDYYGSRGSRQNLQATALTSMALTKLNSNQKNNSEFVKYIVSQKDYRGSWGTTQSTILSLKAINDYSENADVSNQTITVKLNDKEQKIEIKEESLDVYELEFDNVSKENKFSIDMKKGKISYEVIKNYYTPYENIEEKEAIKVTQEITTQTNVNGEIIQKVSIQNNLDSNIENGLLELNIPQGCTPVEEYLNKLQYDNVIEKYEYNYEKINIYLRNFEKGDNTTIEIKYRALYPENVTGAAIRFFDYYNPEIEGICKPVKINVTE